MRKETAALRTNDAPGGGTIDTCSQKKRQVNEMANGQSRSRVWRQAGDREARGDPATSVSSRLSQNTQVRYRQREEFLLCPNEWVFWTNKVLLVLAVAGGFESKLLLRVSSDVFISVQWRSAANGGQQLQQATSQQHEKAAQLHVNTVEHLLWILLFLDILWPIDCFNPLFFFIADWHIKMIPVAL